MPSVKIRTWEDMEAEFGLNKTGNIDCPYVFTTGMEKKLSSDRIIKISEPDSDGDYFWLPYRRIIHTSMIEYFISEKGDSLYGIAKPLGQHSV